MSPIFASMFFGSRRPNHRKILAKLSGQFAIAVDLNDLSDIIFKTLSEDFSTPRIAFYLADSPASGFPQFKLIKNEGFLNPAETLAFNDPLVQELSARKDLVQNENIGALLPCIFGSDFTALLLLKREQKKYDGEEIDLLRVMASQITLVLERIKPYEQIRRELVQTQTMAQESARLAYFATLIQGLAHELRNPLAILLNRAELVKKQIDDKEAIIKFADMTIRNVVRLINLIDTMLHFGKRSPDREWFDINNTVNEVLLLTEGDCKNLSVAVEKDLGRCPKLYGVEAQFNEVILNLILNAIHSIEAAPRKNIFVKTLPAKIPAVGGDAEGIQIIISDTGEGIKKENLAKIFSPFFTTRAHGFGLGLSITKKIIEENKGTISIKSEEGKGTTVIISIPVEAPA